MIAQSKHFLSLVTLWLLAAALHSAETSSPTTAAEPSAAGASLQQAGISQDTPERDDHRFFSRLSQPGNPLWMKNRLLGLLKEYTSYQGEGALLLVPAPGEHAASEGLMHELRHQLLENGWASLALMPGVIDDDDAFRLACDTLRQAGYFNMVLVSQRPLSAEALNRLKSQDDIRSVIFIYHERAAQDPALQEMTPTLETLALPLLEMAPASAQATLAILEERQGLFRRKKIADYRLLPLPYHDKDLSIQVSPVRHLLMGHLQHWLEQYARGQEQHATP